MMEKTTEKFSRPLRRSLRQRQLVDDEEEAQAGLFEENLSLRAQLTRLQALYSQREQPKETEHRYHHMVEQSLGLICTHDFAGNLLYVNPAAARALGYEPQELSGTNLRDFLVPAVRSLFDTYLARIRHQQTDQGFMRLRTKDGKERIWQYQNVRYEENGRPLYIIGCALDITEQISLQRDLRQAKEETEIANRAKREFLATMSHELRTPLNVMLGYTDLLLKGTFSPLTADQQDVLRRIQRSTFALVDLINNVLDLNRLDITRLPVERKVVCIETLFKEIEQETQGLRALSALDFHWQVEPTLPALSTDADKLKIVLKNLLSNAMKFTETGGITLAAYGSADAIVLSVTDTGVGIPASRQTTIFEAFQQGEQDNVRGQRGVGLGLHIAKRLVDLLGGTIEVESAVGRGSTFRVRFPHEEHTRS